MFAAPSVQLLGVGLGKGEACDIARAHGASALDVEDIGAQAWLNRMFAQHKLPIACLELDDREAAKHTAQGYEHMLVTNFRAVRPTAVDGTERPHVDAWTRTACHLMMPGRQWGQKLMHTTRRDLLHAPLFVQDLYDAHSRGRLAQPNAMSDQTSYATLFPAGETLKMLAARAVRARPRQKRKVLAEAPRPRPSRALLDKWAIAIYMLSVARVEEAVREDYFGVWW